MSTRHYTIPLTPEPQSFGITLAGVAYRLTLRWMEHPERGESAQQDIPGTWLLDMARQDDGSELVCGVPLVAGCDLLEPFAYMNFNGALRLSGQVPPTLQTLGGGVELLFVVEDAV